MEYTLQQLEQADKIRYSEFISYLKNNNKNTFTIKEYEKWQRDFILDWWDSPTLEELASELSYYDYDDKSYEKLVIDTFKALTETLSIDDMVSIISDNVSDEDTIKTLTNKIMQILNREETKELKKLMGER